MDQDFYFEETNPRKNKLIFVVILLIITVVFVIFIHYKNEYTLNIKKSVIYEVGDTLSYDIKDYVLNKIVDESDYSISFGGLKDNEALDRVGEYVYKIEYKNITKKGKLIVEDTTAPEVEVGDLIVGVNEEFELDDFVTNCVDYSMPCKVNYKDSKDEEKIKKVGEYEIELVISDAYGNSVTKDVTLEVRKNYSRLSMIKKDLKVDHIDPDFDDWKGEMIISYSEGIDPNEVEASHDKYDEYMDIVSSDLHQYIDEEYANNLITETVIIEVYNKYNYLIGYAIRIKLDNGLYMYLTK